MTPVPIGSKSASLRRNKRSAARLAAVQALYQIELTGALPAAVIEEFRGHRLGVSPEDDGPSAADESYFSELVSGASARREEIDAAIIPLLAAGWTLVRLEAVTRAMLRAGGFELLARGDVPARVVIDEYMQIAHAFFSGKEPAFVNGVLDRLARRFRPDEIDGQPRVPENASGR